MATRHIQKVIDKNGKVKISQYGQWDGYPEGQGVKILNYLKTGDLEKYQKELEKIHPITEEEAEMVRNDKEWKRNYPYLSRDCGANIHRMIEEGKVKFVDLMPDEEAKLWCEGFYTIDFRYGHFITEYKGIKKVFSIYHLPSEEKYINSFKKQ